MSPDLVTKVQEKAERVAQQLELSGLASLHGFINADTGDLKVMDIDTAPPLHPASPVFAQVGKPFLEFSEQIFDKQCPCLSSRDNLILQEKRHFLLHCHKHALGGKDITCTKGQFQSD